MRKEKVTDWYPESAKPVRKGVYGTRIVWPGRKGDSSYSRWDGTFWSNQESTVQACAARPKHDHGIQEKEWRGLAANPKKGKQ